MVDAHDRRLIEAAWYREAFARTKRLRRLSHYLGPKRGAPKPIEEARQDYMELRDRLG